MLSTILVIAGSIILLGVLITLIYKSSRTFDANPNHTYVVQSKGEIAGALREPVTLWNPQMSVLRDKDAPDITFPAKRPKDGSFYTRSLVDKRTGRISLTVNTCTPKPFHSMSLDRHLFEITANVIFRLDIERIHIPSQLDNFGATISDRIENLFDNEISRCRDEEIRANQTQIEQKITSELREIEAQDDQDMARGMPLGIRIYEASFSFREVDKAELNQASGKGAEAYGPLSIDGTQIDRISDALTDTTPDVRNAVMRLIELQTRQNIVNMLCKSGGLVAFTAKELGLTDQVADVAKEKLGHIVIGESAKVEPSAEASSEATQEAENAEQVEVKKDYYGRPIRTDVQTSSEH